MNVVSNLQERQNAHSTTQYDVVVVGAGPYGLSTATHLRGKGLNVAIFGKPMKLWREHMPEGMFLRSHWKRKRSCERSLHCSGTEPSATAVHKNDRHNTHVVAPFILRRMPLYNMYLVNSSHEKQYNLRGAL